MSGSFSCIDDSDKPPSKARYELTMFSNMPYIRQSLNRFAITKFCQIWCIYRKTLCIDAYMFFKSINKVRVSFLCLKKKSHYFCKSEITLNHASSGPSMRSI